MNSGTKWQYYGWQKRQITHFGVFMESSLCVLVPLLHLLYMFSSSLHVQNCILTSQGLLIDVRALTPTACVNNLHSSAIKGERGSLNHTGPLWGRTRQRSQKTQSRAHGWHTLFCGNHGVFTFSSIWIFLLFFFFLKQEMKCLLKENKQRGKKKKFYDEKTVGELKKFWQGQIRYVSSRRKVEEVESQSAEDDGSLLVASSPRHVRPKA